jgi:hypothetical protein
MAVMPNDRPIVLPVRFKGETNAPARAIRLR